MCKIKDSALVAFTQTIRSRDQVPKPAKQNTSRGLVLRMRWSVYTKSGNCYGCRKPLYVNAAGDNCRRVCYPSTLQGGNGEGWTSYLAILVAIIMAPQTTRLTNHLSKNRTVEIEKAMFSLPVVPNCQPISTAVFVSASRFVEKAFVLFTLDNDEKFE